MRKTFIKMSIVLSTLVFTHKASHASEHAYLPGLLTEIEDEMAKKRCHSLQCLVESKQLYDENSKLERVNNFFNQIPYQRDITNWGIKDYWATPVETLIKGKADCEDYAIAKFYTLLQMGIPEEKLYLTYGKLTATGEPHIVLTYYESDQAVPIVLDNRTPDMKTGILYEDFKPECRFNLSKYIALRDGVEHPRSLEKVRFKKWEQFRSRMQRS